MEQEKFKMFLRTGSKHVENILFSNTHILDFMGSDYMEGADETNEENNEGEADETLKNDETEENGETAPEAEPQAPAAKPKEEKEVVIPRTHDLTSK